MISIHLHSLITIFWLLRIHFYVSELNHETTLRLHVTVVEDIERTYVDWCNAIISTNMYPIRIYLVYVLKTCLLVLQTLPVGHMVDKTLHRVVNVWWYINHHIKFIEYSINETWKAKGIWNGPTLTWNILRLLLMSMVIYHHLYIVENPYFSSPKDFSEFLKLRYSFLSLDKLSFFPLFITGPFLHKYLQTSPCSNLLSFTLILNWFFSLKKASFSLLPFGPV